MKYSMALCYLTHDHPDVVREVFDNSLEAYASHGIDVFIYDDSESELTREIVSEYINKGYKNLYYVDAHGVEGADHKYLLIMQGAGLPKDYDYIWPCKDRVYFSSSYLDRLCEAVDEGNDIIMGLTEDSRCEIVSCVYKTYYTDPCEFYRKYGVFSTNWECTIRKRETMLDPVDWDLYREKYGVDEFCNFNQSVSLFARIAEMDSFKARICRFGDDERFISKKVTSHWGSQLFGLWIDKWIAANYRLPEIYDSYKMQVVKSQTNVYELFGSLEMMILYRDKGQYDMEVYEKYRDIWPFITDISPECLRLVAAGDDDRAIKYALRDFEDSVKQGNFDRAYWYLKDNTWFKSVYGEAKFGIICHYFWLYGSQMNVEGKSNVFDGIGSLDDLFAVHMK